MIATLPSASLLGIQAQRIEVEVDVAPGLPAYHVVGLPATSIKEGARRIRSALRNCGQDIPARRVTVNLAPADLRKEGASFDLAVAVGVVVAAGAFSSEALGGLLLLGELGLDGTIRRVRGVLSAACLARDQGMRGLLVPRGCAAEASVVPGVDIYVADHFSQVLAALDGKEPLAKWSPSPGALVPLRCDGDFADVRGQAVARRAAEIAVAGGHNLLLYGPPGVGKTMIARRLPTIMPPLSHEESIEVTQIFSAAGLLPAEGMVTQRPFRAPHHATSVAGLIGGGASIRPGEISLAHRGVLFLDELPEFGRAAIELLRQPLEEKVVRLGRARGVVRMPAAFQLVASANPCPCGFYGSVHRACTCSPGTIERYRSRLSGPFLDRIDLQVRVEGVAISDMRCGEGAEGSRAIYARVREAKERQERRLGAFSARTNAEMSSDALRATCFLTASAEKTLARIFSKRPGLSARSIDRMVRVARTIADLDGENSVDAGAIHEAASYRAFDTEPLGQWAGSRSVPSPAFVRPDSGRVPIRDGREPALSGS